jgi:hypothetical protein
MSATSEASWMSDIASSITGAVIGTAILFSINPEHQISLKGFISKEI